MSQSNGNNVGNKAVRRAPASGPTRFGAPASKRNFQHSSASGSSTGKHNAVSATERANKERAWGSAYVASDDSIRNDYAGEYVRTGSRPQNFIANTALETRFREHPKLNALLKAKHAQLDDERASIPPVLLAQEPAEAVERLAKERATFDVILLSPTRETTYDELARLDIPRIAGSPGFVWLWVGSGQPGDGIGLEQGRNLLASWGYRRCEDIVWLKTNKGHPERDLTDPCSSLLRPTVEHCLMGIRGTVRRSNDGWFAHCNVDTDVIVCEPHEDDADMKPQEIQSLIENFCLGTRRLHLYAGRTSPRRGWLSVGSNLPDPDHDEVVIRPVEHESRRWRAIPYSHERWSALFASSQSASSAAASELPLVPPVLPLDTDVDNLRPKSPPGKPGVPSSGGLGRGRGAGLGVTRSEVANRIGAAGHGRGRGLTPPGPSATGERRSHSGPPQFHSPFGPPTSGSSHGSSPSVPSPVFPWTQPWPPNNHWVSHFPPNSSHLSPGQSTNGEQGDAYFATNGFSALQHTHASPSAPQLSPHPSFGPPFEMMSSPARSLLPQELYEGSRHLQQPHATSPYTSQLHQQQRFNQYPAAVLPPHNPYSAPVLPHSRHGHGHHHHASPASFAPQQQHQYSQQHQYPPVFEDGAIGHQYPSQYIDMSPYHYQQPTHLHPQPPHYYRHQP